MEAVNAMNIIMLVGGLLSLITIIGLLYFWAEHSPKAKAIPYAFYAVAIVYEFSEEQLKKGNPIYELEKLALVDLTYQRVLPVEMQAQISREQWAKIVEATYTTAVQFWDTSAHGLRDAFAEWKAKEKPRLS